MARNSPLLRVPAVQSADVATDKSSDISTNVGADKSSDNSTNQSADLATHGWTD
jgi:hypothetical protein